MTKTKKLKFMPIEPGRYEVSKEYNKYDAATDTVRVNDASKIYFNPYFDFGRLENKNDKDRIITLCANINIKNILVMKNKHHGKKYLNKEEIGEIVKLEGQSLKKFMGRMKKADIILKYRVASSDNKKQEMYLLSPAIATTKGNISPLAYALFRKDLQYLSDSDKATLEYRYNLNRQDIDIKTEAVKFLTNTDEVAPEIKSCKAIFNEYVLNNTPEYFHLDGKKMTEGFNAENCFYLVQGSDRKGRKAENITEYRNLFLDIDAGKDENKEYFKGEQLATRKAKIKALIDSVLPDATAIVETRNGYHVLYAIKPTTDKEAWQKAQNKLVSSFAVADDIKDASRILRCPGTVWNKDNNKYDTFNVEVIEANEIRYDLKDLDLVFDYEEIKAKSEALADELGLKHAKGNNTAKKAGKTANKAVLTSQRLNDLKAKKEIKELRQFEEIKEMTKEDFKKYLREFNMRELFGLAPAGNVCCLMHDDKHPSAIVEPSKDGVYRMYCFNADCEANDKAGVDNIDVLRHISNMSYMEAIQYMAQVFNVRLA